MWITVTLTCAAGALFAHRLRLSADSRRGWRRREQLLVMALRDTSATPAPRTRLTPRRAEMERLLHGLQTSATHLAAALAAEAGSVHEAAACEHWRHSRTSVDEAQRAYDDAVRTYEEFVQQLAVPLRAKAAERGFAARSLVHVP